MNNQFDPNNQYNQNYQNNQYQQQYQYNQNNQYNPNGQNQSVNINEIIAKVKEFLLNTPVDKTPINTQDMNENKMISILSYLIILCWIPMVAKPNSRFVRFHFNQGLLLLISATVAFSVVGISSIFLSHIPIVGKLLVAFISSAVSLVTVVGIVLGIYNVINGRLNELPFIGKYRIVKTVPDVTPNNFNNTPPQNGYNNPQQPNGFNNVPPQNGYNGSQQPNNFNTGAYNGTTPNQSTGFDVEAYSNGTANAGFGTNNNQNNN